MLTAEASPVWTSFAQLLDHLGGEARISPERFAALLGIDMQTLAAKAHVHHSTLRLAPSAESVQGYLRQSLRVLHAAVDVAGEVPKAVFWFKNYPIPTFDYRTAVDLVSEGRSDDVVRYLQSLQAGFAG
jgi:uncharacterized protein (DUF2384 family)